MNTDLKELSFDEEFFCEEVREGFYISETMKRHWAASLKVLSEIDKICRRHDLNWYADCGTLLGAVREKGFIPWDDDIDIAMLRDDFELFLSYAYDELPEGYCIAYDSFQDTPRNPFIYHNPFCGISNTGTIRNDPEFLEEFYYCPFVSSVDIFPLDRLYNDPQKEEDRKKRAKLVYTTYWGIINNDFAEKELKILIPIIEKDNHIKLGRGDIQRKLLQLFNTISQECKDEDSVRVAKIYEWAMDMDYSVQRSYYDEWVEAAYETTKVRIPKEAHETLTSLFGDYMTPVRGTGVHNYPCYEEHEKIFRKAFGKKSCGYTFKKDKFESISSKTTTYKRACELFQLIHDLHGHISNCVESGNFENATTFLQNCQEAAVSIGGALEEKFGNGTDAVSALEQYCEKVYQASECWNENTRAELDDILSEAERKTRELNENKERDVLFLPCRAAWWNTMRDVFMTLESDKRNKISVIPIPYYFHDHTDMIGKMRRDTEEFDKLPELEGKITNFDEYDIEKRHPDVIVIQYQFDGTSSIMGVPELLYSSNLTQYTDNLVFVPAMNPDPPQSDNDIAAKAMLDLVEQPAVFNSDLVVIGSEELKRYYIDTLVSISGEPRSYWEERVCTKEDLNRRIGGE